MLSKSKYLNGLQCPRLLWFKARKPSEIPAVTEATQLKFEQGSEIGLLAQKLFPDGLLIEHNDFFGGIAATRDALKYRRTIFEAAFYDKEKNLYSRADILVPHGEDAWDIYEVKSAASVKSEYLEDMAFQKYVYERSGLEIADCYIIHVNTKYTRQGEVDLNQLFSIVNVNEKIEAISEEIWSRIDEENRIIAQDSAPPNEIGMCCFNPYECPLKEKCWTHVPYGSVFELGGGNKIPSELWKQGYVYLKDIPLDLPELTDKQKNQITAYKNQKAQVDREQIQEWLDKLVYPLYYLDFETYDTAVPLYDGCRPYQKIPFQFSLHTQKEKNGPSEHFSYISEGNADERRQFAEALQDSLGHEGSIVVYYDSFEKRVIREIGELFPDMAEWAESTNERVVDLLVPFQNHYFHSPVQKGSASIKKVLPALTDRSYDDMEIGNGEMASYQFTRIVLGKADENEAKQTKDNLFKYCELDTLSMVLLVEALYGLASGQEVASKKDMPKENEQLKFRLDFTE